MPRDPVRERHAVKGAAHISATVAFRHALDVTPGNNLICTALNCALTRLLEDQTQRGREAYIDTLVVQVNKCIGENKNHVVLGCLSSLVRRSAVGNIVFNSMMVGHTHIRIDQVFSR